MILPGLYKDSTRGFLGGPRRSQERPNDSNFYMAIIRLMEPLEAMLQEGSEDFLGPPRPS